MRSLTKPNPAHDYDAAAEIAALRRYRDTAPGRAIPATTPGSVLIATWNIANLGVHKRRPIDFDLAAEMISWFELVALQEIADNLDHVEAIADRLPNHYGLVFSDKGGNNERAAYFYDTRRVTLGPKIGEVVIVESERANISLPGITRRFSGFNRNPFIASFHVGGVDLVLVNVHLFYGKTDTAAQRKEAMEKRQLEAYAVARWCDLRRRSKNRFTSNILAVGDFNLPEAAPGDPIYEALTARGLRLPDHATRIPGTNLGGDHDYDQIAIVPGLKNRIEASGVFDFDGAIFRDIWDPQAPSYWRTCTKYYISDHRPLWIQLRLTP